jgi:hypothetical protein
MKRMILTILSLVSLPLAIGHALAQKSDASAQVDRLPFPIGELSCTGNVSETPKRPGYATVAGARVEKALDGNWIAIHYDEERTAANPHPYGVVQYIGYEDAGKRFVSVVVDNNAGSGYATGVSPGWQGNAMTFDETMAGSKDAKFRDTFTANGDVFTHTGTMLGKDKKWVKTDEETCHKR